MAKEKISKEFKVGLSVIFGVAIFIVGMLFLKGSNVFESSLDVYVVYDQAEGVVEGTPVEISGVSIGRVKSVELHPDNSDNVLVKVYLELGDYKLKKDAIAKLASSDILGTKVIRLENGFSPELVVAGDTLDAKMEKSLIEVVDERIKPLEEKTKNLISQIDSLVTTIRVVFDSSININLSESFVKLNETFSSLKRTAKSLEVTIDENGNQIDTIMNSVKEFSYTLEGSARDLKNLLSNLSDISDSISEADVAAILKNASITLEKTASLTESIERGEGSLGMILKKDSLHNEVVSSMKKLQELLDDMKANPSRYVQFSVVGRKSKGIPLTKKEVKQLKYISEEMKKRDTIVIIEK